MAQPVETGQMVKTLELFLSLLNEYFEAIKNSQKLSRVTGTRNQQLTSPDEPLSQLRRMEPLVTDIIVKVEGNSTISLSTLRGRRSVRNRDLLPTALLMGYENLREYREPATATLERTIGMLEAGLWPPKTPTPVLVIRDDQLRERCADLLSAPGSYDRVVREATTVLEDRISSRPPFEVLAKLIPHTADQTGDNLVNRLFSPDHPILSISDDRTKRIAFHRILLGVVSYLRNPYHHGLDAETAWSWAWSSVGLIDKLLADIEGCTLIAC